MQGNLSLYTLLDTGASVVTIAEKVEPTNAKTSKVKIKVVTPYKADWPDPYDSAKFRSCMILHDRPFEVSAERAKLWVSRGVAVYA